MLEDSTAVSAAIMSAGHINPTMMVNSPLLNSTAASNHYQHTSCVTHDILLSTVKALVDHFENKINDLAKSSMKADFVANKESSVEIVDKIQRML